MELRAVDYRAGEVALRGFVADGSGDRRVPGVLVAHEGPGITGHVLTRTQRLAELGYVAFAIDLFGEAEPPLERAKQFVRQLREDRAELRRRARAGLDRLAAEPNVDTTRLAAIGFCFGGMAVLELARAGAELAAVVGFHADLTSAGPTAPGAVRGQVLVCLGADDPIVDGAQRSGFVAEMTAARADWQMVVYGGAGHSFTNPDIDAYGFPGFAWHAVADRRSWQAMRALFDEAFGGREV